ncbi:hypothetical protein [Mesorhizobium shangrilense]|uniref:Uncharacterized protein n=1 Tax=Mesorhizobium shangrilense TaxID=460060 RepID=A0ABV2DPS0_9HYPH
MLVAYGHPFAEKSLTGMIAHWNKKRMAVDIARAINEREAKRDAMRQQIPLRVIK